MIQNPRYEALQALARELDAGATGTDLEARLHEAAGWQVKRVRYYWRRRRLPERTRWGVMSSPLWRIDDAVALARDAFPEAVISMDMGPAGARCRLSAAPGTTAVVQCAETAPRAVMLALVHALIAREPMFLCESCSVPTNLVDRDADSFCREHGGWRRPGSCVA